MVAYLEDVVLIRQIVLAEALLGTKLPLFIFLLGVRGTLGESIRRRDALGQVIEMIEAIIEEK